VVGDAYPRVGGRLLRDEADLGELRAGRLRQHPDRPLSRGQHPGDHEAAAVELEITDDGRGAAGRRDGHGIKGMRERVALYEGTFQAGTRPEGGFTVTARFPA